MKLVVLENIIALQDLNWKELEKLVQVVYYDYTADEETVAHIGDAQAVLTSQKRITRADMEQCPNLKYIGITGVGTDHVDLAAARELGVTVTNNPEYGPGLVAQMAAALLFELCNHVGWYNAEVQSGRWQASRFFTFFGPNMVELEGKVCGVIGYGNIGRRFAKVAEAVGMQVLVYDEYASRRAGNETVEFAELGELLQRADVISLHCPYNAGTHHMLNAQTLSQTKRGILIVNSARGGLIDEAALAAALESGQVGGAALDVLTEEPPRGGSPLLDAKNCIVTPHIGWCAAEARARIIHTVTENVRAYLAGTPQHVVAP